MTVTKLNDENFEKEVNESDIPVIIDFYADWCGPCQMMKPMFEELSEEYKGKLKFARLDTEEAPAISSKFGIDRIPCLIIIKEEKEAGRIFGFRPKDDLKKEIDSKL